MSADHDQTFVRTFLAVLGALVAFTFFIIVVAIAITGGDDELLPEQVDRIQANTQPVFEVVTDPAALQKVAAQSNGASGSDSGGEPQSGEQVYQAVCSACHAAGVAGAPKTDDKDAWSSRMNDGKEALYTNAINGLNAMPAKGGDPSLSDAEVKASVDHILEKTGL